jgi:hypothetical protein
MFEQRVQRAKRMRGASATLLLVVAFAGCAGWERDRHPHQYAVVVPRAACPDVRTSPPLDWLGGYHLTRWHSSEPTTMLPSAAGDLLPGPVLVPQEEVPIPEPAGRESDRDGKEEDSVLPDALPGIRSSMNPARDIRLTQTTWPVVIPSRARGVVRLPTVVEQILKAEADWCQSGVAIDPVGYDGDHGRPDWWRQGPLVAKPVNQERVSGPLRR